MQTDYGKNIRKFLSKGHIEKIIDFGSLPIFAEAETYPAIFRMTKFQNESVDYIRINSVNELNVYDISNATIKTLPINKLSSEAWNVNEFNIIEKLNQIEIKYLTLKEIAATNIGDLTGMDNAFVVTDTIIKEHKFVYF